MNNPLRVPEVSAEHRRAQKDKAGWDDLCAVLQSVETAKDARFTESVFRQVLTEVYARLDDVRVSYPVPGRISLESTMQLIEGFLSERSGGQRFEALAAALFRTLGRVFGLFQDIRRTHVTAADAAAGMAADIECVDDAGATVLIVEAKDRAVTIRQLLEKIPGLRAHKVFEAFFVASGGVLPEEEEALRDLIAKEFVTGQNIYVTELAPLARATLAIVGERGRRAFLENVGLQLNEFAEIHHRRAWADLLRRL